MHNFTGHDKVNDDSAGHLNNNSETFVAQLCLDAFKRCGQIIGILVAKMAI